jgi:hypothetical protein
MNRLKRVQVSHHASPTLFSREWEASGRELPLLPAVAVLYSCLLCLLYVLASVLHEVVHTACDISHFTIETSFGQARPGQSRHSPPPPPLGCLDVAAPANSPLNRPSAQRESTAGTMWL